MSQLGHAATEMAGLGGSIAAIAVTATFSQMAFADSIGASIPFLSDWGGDTAAAYGVRYDEWKGHAGVAKRAVFVIGTDRTVAYRWSTNDALEFPPLEEALDAMRSLAAQGGKDEALDRQS